MDGIVIKSEEEGATMEDTEIVMAVKDEEMEYRDISFLKCPQCDLAFECLLALDNHIRFHTKEHPFECFNCYESFKTDKELYAHSRTSKDCSLTVKPDNDSGENHKCNICNKVLSTPYALLRHQRLHTGERPFKCLECKERFIDAGLLSKHMTTHTGSSDLQCKICSKVCVSQKRLADHMFVHNGKKRYQCPVCDKLCRCKSHLDDHLRIHSGEKPFKCNLCEVSYRYKSQLREHHLTKHPTTEAYSDDVPPGKAKCEICDAIVAKHSMRNHKMLHKGKQYKCDRCRKSYVSQYRLTVHQRVHTGDKPFKCNIPGCNKAMSTKDGYLRHMVIHEGKKDFKCSECDREFFFRSNLNQHLKIHYRGTERFPCDRCGKCFSRNSVLKTHLLSPCLGVIVVDQANSDANATTSSQSLRAVPSCSNDSNQVTDSSLQAVSTDNNRDDDVLALQQQSSVVLFDTSSLNIPSLVTNEAEFAEGETIVIHNVLSPSHVAVSSSQHSSEHSYHNQSLNTHTHTHTQQIGIKAELVEEDQTADADYQNGALAMHEEFPTEQSYKAVATQTISEKRQTTTTLHQVADKIIEVEHPNDIVFTKDDISNLMTLAGVSTVSRDSPAVQTDVSEVDLKFVYTDTEFDSGAEPNFSQVQESNDRNADSISTPASTSVLGQSTITATNTSTLGQGSTSVLEQANTFLPGNTNAPRHASTSALGQTITPAPGQASISVHERIRISAPKEPNIPPTVEIERSPSEEHFLNITGIGNLDSETPSQRSFSDSDTEMSSKSLLDPDSTLDPQQGTSGERKRNEKSKDSTELHSHDEHDIDSALYIHECLHCDSKFRYHYSLEEHCELSHSGQDVYKCHDCTETFDSTRSLMRHTRTHSGNSSVQCHVCQRMFAHPQKLSNHMVKKHFGDRVKRFRCDSCGHLFPDSTHLRDHMMVHSGIKPYKCNQCHREFIRKRELETHMRIHTGELPFKCTKCAKGFRAAIYLNNHMLTHAEAKPFQCSECDKGYVRRSKLRLHMMTHNGSMPYKCEEPGCGKSYCEKREFVNHSMTHRGIKSYKCMVCPKAFTMKGNLVQHERIHNRP